MEWYYWLFPPIMTALPLGMVWWAERTLPPAPNVAWRRWGKALLPAAIVLIIAGYLAALAVFGQVAWVTHGLAYLYFPVWGAAMVLTIRPDPNFGERNLNRAERAASLTPRHRESPIPSALWTAAWMMSIIGAGGLLLAACLNGAAAMAMFSCAICAAFAVFSVALTHWTLPMALQEPEPLDALGNPALPNEYARFRNERVWTLFLMFAFGMPILVLGCGAGLLWATFGGVHGWVIGAAGGVLGTLLGVFGAFFGMRADAKRKQLRELLAQTEAHPVGDGAAMQA